MAEPRIRLENEGAVATLVLDRPDKLNALDLAMLDELALALRTLDRDATVRCVLVRGEGRAFCAGGDIDAWSELEPEAFALRWVREGNAVFDALARLRQPTIAVLDGHALGGGFELAACCDVRVAEAHIKLGQPETGLGVVPGWSGTQRAVRRFGAQVIRRMALMGEVFDAPQARDLGLVDHVVPSGEALAKARAIADAVAARGPLATQMTKLLVNAADGEEPARALDALAGGWAAHSGDLHEGVAAFRQRRRAVFEGR